MPYEASDSRHKLHRFRGRRVVPNAGPNARRCAEIRTRGRACGPKSGNTYMSGPLLRGTRYELHNATMVDVIRTAYSLDDSRKVVGGPGWMDMDRFEIAAKVPPSTSPETLALMLQDLLADRFKLVVHKETRPMSLWVLSLGKGKPKLKESKEQDGGNNQGCRAIPQNPAAGEVPYNVNSCRGVTMDELAARLPVWANAYVSGRVINQTGIEGAWDFDLKWTSRGSNSGGGIKRDYRC